MDDVFKAIADSTRRLLMDRLMARDGQTLGELCEGLEMSRQAVTKHLRLLEDANLLSSQRVGREKRHYLNPVPIREIHDRWISRYAQQWVGAMAALKADLEGENMSAPAHVYVSYIRTTPEKLWAAITRPEHTSRYFFETRVQSTWERGAPVAYLMSDEAPASRGEVLVVEPPRRLVMTWTSMYDEALAADAPSTVTWEIEAQGEISKLTLTHAFESETKTWAHVKDGWPLILDGLKTLVETGEPLQ